ILFVLWALVAWTAIDQAIELRRSARLPFLLGSNGIVSQLQTENFNESRAQVLPGDRILKFEGVPFHPEDLRKFLKSKKSGDGLRLEVERNQKATTLQATLSRFSKGIYLILFFIPLLLSLLFVG